MPVDILALHATVGGVCLRFKGQTTDDFDAMRLRIKALSVRDRAWQPAAFSGKGGWWLSTGAWQRLGPLFRNFAEVRRTLDGDPPEPPPVVPPPTPPEVTRAFATLHLLPSAPLCVVEAAWRALCKETHPDWGGTTARMQQVNAARDVARAWAVRQHAA